MAGSALHRRLGIGFAVLLLSIVIGVVSARATEIVPSVGLTRAAEGDDQAKMYGNLAVRGNLLPILQTEIGVGYRQESRSDDLLRLKMVPVTGSLWFTPFPALYAGGGVGWYFTRFDYDQDKLIVPVEDETKQEFGVHLGGGLKVPIAPAAAVDLQGRYVMLREQDNKLVPGHFDPDFWTTSLGIAFKF
jgi:hypothetical protein